MSSVTGRIREITQPKGGYINPSQFEEITFDDQKKLGTDNIHAALIGMAVDYLTRFMTGGCAKDAFEISILGYKQRKILLGRRVVWNDKKQKIDIRTLIKQIRGLDDSSIVAACKACSYDVWYRNPISAMRSKGGKTDITPNNETINNIRIMVQRSMAFWEKFGPITVSGFTFEKRGYTKTVNAGDGDYLTADTLWDFKVIKSKPTSKHTLQLLMYWIMGQHSGKKEFKNITKLGIFNPRLNKVYLLSVNDIQHEVIRAVENDVICYPSWHLFRWHH